MAFSARRDFIRRRKKQGLRAHVGAEVTGAEDSATRCWWNRERGYQNLCRLITRMKLGAPKGEGAITEGDLAEYAHGPGLPDRWRRRAVGGGAGGRAALMTACDASSNSAACLGAATFMSSCSGISILRKKRATTPPSRLPSA